MHWSRGLIRVPDYCRPPVRQAGCVVWEMGRHIYPLQVTLLLCSQATINLWVQIHVHPPNTEGVIVKCHSGGCFPWPLMEWRDNRGEVFPVVSKSHSQGGDRLFNMNLSLLIRDSSFQKVICCLQNSLTDQEGRTSVILSDAFFFFVEWDLEKYNLWWYSPFWFPAFYYVVIITVVDICGMLLGW